MCGGGSDVEGPGSTSGGRGGGFGGVADSAGGGFGMSSVSGNTAAGVGGAGFGGNTGRNKGERGDTNAPSGLRSIENAHKGLAIAGPQRSRARDNAAATNLSYGLRALGLMTGFVGFNVAAGLVTAARDYGRSYAERTPMEKAAKARGMGAVTHGESTPANSTPGTQIAPGQTPAQIPAKGGASGNAGAGTAGATVIMGAEKTRTGAGAGGRAKGSAVRGFGSGGLKL